jgi:outer membrane lipoprotein-sorting protein
MRTQYFKFIFLLATVTVFGTPPPVVGVLDKLQSTWDKTQNYRAKFNQTVYSKKLHTTEETSGTIFVMKPGKIRWEIPGQKTTQILNGNRLTQIRENTRRKKVVVDIYKDVSKSIDLKALAFLAGTASFRETYQSVLGPEDIEKIELKLTPKTSPGETYLAEIDKKSYFLRALTTESADSKVRIDFSNTEANTSIDKSLFEYQPKPTDIVHENP